MDVQLWQVTVEFTSREQFDDDDLFDMVGGFDHHGASAAVTPNGMGWTLTVVVEAETALGALIKTLDGMNQSRILNGFRPTGFEVISQNKIQRIRTGLQND